MTRLSRRFRGLSGGKEGFSRRKRGKSEGWAYLHAATKGAGKGGEKNGDFPPLPVQIGDDIAHEKQKKISTQAYIGGYERKEGRRTRPVQKN